MKHWGFPEGSFDVCKCPEGIYTEQTPIVHNKAKAKRIMYARLIIEMPLKGNGAPAVPIDQVFKYVAPELRRAIAEGLERGQSLIPLNDPKASVDGRETHASVSWEYHIHAEIGPVCSVESR